MKYHAAIILLFSAFFTISSGCGPDKSIKYYNLGLDAIQRNDYNEAIKLWNESLKYNPDDPETRYNLGAALVALNRYPEAEPHLRRAVELNSNDPDAQGLLGKSLQEQGKLAEAKNAYGFALGIKPMHIPSLVGLAAIALKEDQNKSAEEYATRAVELDPRSIEANLLLAEAYLRNGNANSAYVQLLSARKLDPMNSALLLLFGKAAYERHMYADAHEALEASRTLGASTDELYCYLGLTDLAMGDASEAEKHFRLAIYKNGENERAWKGLCETFIKERKWTEAAEAIGKALSLDPDDSEAILDEAILNMNSGNLGAAVQRLESLRLRSDAPQIAGFYLGHAYLRMGKNAEAKATLQRFAETWEGDKALSEEAREIAGQLIP
jgi:Flp pilus assembly protein TadD